jgi:GNAT superfamily N-acetyltransferase
VALQPPYIIVPLGAGYDRATFSCGEPSLDGYLQRQASQDVKRDLAACYVLAERDRATIIGYYTLSATSVELTDLPPALAKKSGRYPLVPAVLLGRLAVDHRFQGQGMSGLLLMDALRRTLRTGLGIKLMVVDALNDSAARFYEHYDFRRFEDQPLRLYLPLSAIRELFPIDIDTPPGAGEVSGEQVQ